MPGRIRGLYIHPPIAIARLGGSSTPMDSFRWIDSPDPHLQTVITPDWTLDVAPDATVVPRLPETVVLRDGDLIRPVAPFFELWAEVLDGEGTGNAQLRPLTSRLLAEFDLSSDDLSITVDVANSKAARRTRNPVLRFGTFPAVTVRGSHHRPVPLIGVSPPTPRPMIPRDSPGVPLGFIQVLRSRPQPTVPVPWPSTLDLEIIRLRFTPAKGRFYGPPQAARVSRRGHAAVAPDCAFLDEGAGWAGAPMMPWVDPPDTFDGVETPPDAPPNYPNGGSLGVVDDTCAGTITVALEAIGVRAYATIMVGPPHFAPDRRPFLSLADELIDRQARGATADSEDADNWVRDLFERVYETASLINVDHWRDRRAAELLPSQQRPAAIPGDGVPDNPEHPRAMGGRDILRDATQPIPASTPDIPLPITERARERHRVLAELNELRTLIQQDPDRLRHLIRPPFVVAPNETQETSSMQMPPFMRNSNAFPLTLAAWQYEMLFRWVAALQAVRAQRAAQVPPLSEAAERRRSAVLARLRSR